MEKIVVVLVVFVAPGQGDELSYNHSRQSKNKPDAYCPSKGLRNDSDENTGSSDDVADSARMSCVRGFALVSWLFFPEQARKNSKQYGQ